MREGATWWLGEQRDSAVVSNQIQNRPQHVITYKLTHNLKSSTRHNLGSTGNYRTLNLIFNITQSYFYSVAFLWVTLATDAPIQSKYPKCLFIIVFLYLLPRTVWFLYSIPATCSRSHVGGPNYVLHFRGYHNQNLLNRGCLTARFINCVYYLNQSTAKIGDHDEANCIAVKIRIGRLHWWFN